MQHKIKMLYLFCGIGGATAGFQNAEEEYKGIKGNFETICGIDCDPEACQDFENITGSRAVCMDLFSREQYIKFHGNEPPKGWKEIRPEDIRKACGGVKPDGVFLSAPCKGFSGLLSEKAAKSDKYQALNQLTIRGIKLVCEAFKDDLPGIILFENVPRIKTRGSKLLDEIREVLNEYNYVINPPKNDIHDCGEIGGLAQHRKRYLLMARNPKKIPGFIYEPTKKRVKAIGEILENMPMPGDESAGPMHRISKLQWRTWMRLALIPAGGDWRNLENNFEIVKVIPTEKMDSIYRYQIETDGSINKDTVNIDLKKENRHTSHYKVVPWNEPSGTVTGASHVANGLISVQDIRVNSKPRNGTYGVMEWDKPAATIIGSADVHAGAAAIADPRIPNETDKGVWIIISSDGTWHRPLTTLELAALQGLPIKINGKPLNLAGSSDARKRERIGNMVPTDAGEAIGRTILRALLPVLKNEIVLGCTPIWVDPIAAKL